jgi:hypothetical protein
MGKVILGSTVSLDGYIDDRNGSMEAPYSDLGDWRETDPGKESIQNTGAVVMGRNSYAMAEDPDRFAGNYEYQVPFGRQSGSRCQGCQYHRRGKHSTAVSGSGTR